MRDMIPDEKWQFVLSGVPMLSPRKQTVKDWPLITHLKRGYHPPLAPFKCCFSVTRIFIDVVQTLEF